MRKLTDYDIFSLKIETNRKIQDMSLLISDLFSKIKTQKHISTTNNWQDDKCCVHFMVNGSFRTEATITMNFLKDDIMNNNDIVFIKFDFQLYDKNLIDVISFFDYFKFILNNNNGIAYHFNSVVDFDKFKYIKSKLNVDDYEVWKDSSMYNL